MVSSRLAMARVFGNQRVRTAGWGGVGAAIYQAAGPKVAADSIDVVGMFDRSLPCQSARNAASQASRNKTPKTGHTEP